METELISVAEAKDLHPIFEEKYFVGAMCDAHEGHVDPTGVTHAYAKAARQERCRGVQRHLGSWHEPGLRRRLGHPDDPHIDR